MHSAVTPAIYSALQRRGGVGSHASADEEDKTAQMTRAQEMEGWTEANRRHTHGLLSAQLDQKQTHTHTPRYCCCGCHVSTLLQIANRKGKLRFPSVHWYNNNNYSIFTRANALNC